MGSRFLCAYTSFLPGSGGGGGVRGFVHQVLRGVGSSRFLFERAAWPGVFSVPIVTDVIY